MPTRLRRRSPFKALILPVILCAVAGYFGWQGTRGDFSHDAREEMRAERAARQAVLADLIAQRQALEARVERLRVGALDADLLDERARAKLNMAHANEIVIFHTPQAERQPVSQALVSR
ncbi:MAG: septum formation initiator family protein [Pseudomonadota bacterium]